MRSDQIADQFDICGTHFAPLHYHILCHGAKITATTHGEYSPKRWLLYLFFSIMGRERLPS
jgi:hypothetical protein